MITMNISLNKELVKIVDREIKTQKYANRSEFFRDLIRRQYVIQESFSSKKEYYQTLNNTMKDWNDPISDNLLKSDYAIIKRRKKHAKFIGISELKK